MFSNEKWFDADGQLKSKKYVIFAHSREEADLIEGLHEVDKWPMKVMCFIGVT